MTLLKWYDFDYLPLCVKIILRIRHGPDWRGVLLLRYSRLVSQAAEARHSQNPTNRR